MNKLMGWLDNKDLGLLLIRLNLAAVFIYAGWMKFADLDMTMAGFAQVGLAPFFVYLVAAVEVLSGLSMLLGKYTKYAGLLLAIVMAFAIGLVTRHMDDLVYMQFDIALLVAALGVAMIGPGKWTVK